MYTNISVLCPTVLGDNFSFGMTVFKNLHPDILHRPPIATVQKGQWRRDAGLFCTIPFAFATAIAPRLGRLGGCITVRPERPQHKDDLFYSFIYYVTNGFASAVQHTYHLQLYTRSV